jgi:hypothetical protein
MVCTKCYGTGKYLGQGMMSTDCNCLDDEVSSQEKTSVPVPVDKRSSSYRTAIKEIMDLNPGITRASAVKMFDEAYDRV